MNSTHKERLRQLRENGTMHQLTQTFLAELLWADDPNSSAAASGCWLQAVQESVRQQQQQAEAPVTVHDLLVESILPAGQAAVPAAVQAKMMARIQQVLQKES
jgi:hypothetical protein